MYSNEDYLDNIFSSAYINVNDNTKRSSSSSSSNRHRHLNDKTNIITNATTDNIVNRIRNLKNDKKLKRKKSKNDNTIINTTTGASTNGTAFSINNNDISRSNPSDMDRSYIDLYQTKRVDNTEALSQSSSSSLLAITTSNIKTKSTMKRSISLTEFGRSSFNEITVGEFPRWNTLQGNYLQQITSLARKILSELTPMVHKHQLLTLLVAHRNIVVKMIEIYQHAETEALEKNILKATNAATSIRSSLIQLATCLDFLHVHPFLYWFGVDPKLNPLLLMRKLNGSHAGLDHVDIARELVVSDDDEKLLLAANDLLWDIYYCGSHPTTSKSVKFSESNISGPLKEHWDHWRWAYVSNCKVKEYHLSVKMQQKRKIFQAFERYHWVNNRMKEMRTKQNKRLLIVVVMYWQRYTAWCRRFHQLHRRSLLSIKRICFQLLHEYTNEHHETRVWKSSINQILMKKYFKDLKTFTKLSKHELKTRLKRGSTLTFDDKNLLRCTYDQWSRRIKMAGKLYGLDELLLYNHTKKAFDTWRVNTNIGRSIVLTAVKQVLKDKASDLQEYTKEQAKSIYKFTKVKAREGYDHAKAHARANIRKGNKIFNKKLQQLTRKVKEKIEDTYNHHFNSTNVRKKLFAIAYDDDNNNNDNNDDNNNSTSPNDNNDSANQELTPEMKERIETNRKSRLQTSIKLARAKSKALNSCSDKKDSKKDSKKDYEANNITTKNSTNEEVERLERFRVVEENDKIQFLR